MSEDVTYPPILLVEDDASHTVLVERVLRKARLANPLMAFRSGDEAIDYLEGRGKYSDRGTHPLPALALLDNHVLGRSGLEVLASIRGRTELAHIPVVMFSGSGESEDINRAFEIGVDTYLVKPVAFDALLDAVQGLELPWVVLGRGARDGSDG